MLTLQGCLDNNEWDEFIESIWDIDELTTSVSSWISCEEAIIPEKVIRVHLKSKPWVSKEVKVLLDKRTFFLNREIYQN